MIAALTAAAHNDVSDRENIDPFSSMGGKYTNDSKTDDEKSESSFETVIHCNSKPDGFWSESTPAATTGRTRKSLARRKSTKRKTAPTGLYPQLSLYPDISGGANVPTTTSEEFGKIAEGILEEMNTRVAGTLPQFRRLRIAKQQGVEPVSSPPVQTIFKDVVIPLKESPSIPQIDSRHRFSDVHNKIFHKLTPR